MATLEDIERKVNDIDVVVNNGLKEKVSGMEAKLRWLIGLQVSVIVTLVTVTVL